MKPKFKLEHVAAALRASGGVISGAANKLEQAYGSCTPMTVRNYVKRHASLRTLIEDIVENNLDIAESALLQAMTERNMTAVIFYLKTKGKHRGYVERVEATGEDGGPIPIVISLADTKL